MFYLDVAKLSGCCMYMQVFQVFFIRMLVFHLDVCICLQWLHTCFQVFSGVLQVFHMYVVSVSVVLDVCCKCFIWILQK
jgi:hypothetical protein